MALHTQALRALDVPSAPHAARTHVGGPLRPPRVPAARRQSRTSRPPGPACRGGSADQTLTPAGVVHLSADEADAERKRLESTDAFAELVALAAQSGPPSAAQPSAAKAFSSGGLKKPPWLRQRAPQGERCVAARR